MQTTHQFIFSLCQCRFYTRQSIAVQQFKLHSGFFQNLDIALHRIQLRIFTENLQSAFRAVLIRDANIATQITQTVTAVFSHTHHPFFIDCIMLGITVFQHLCHPLQLPQAAIDINRQRCMMLKHPFDCLKWNTWCSPRGRISWRNLPGITEAGFLRRTCLTIQHSHGCSLLRQIVSACHTNHTTT